VAELISVPARVAGDLILSGLHPKPLELLRLTLSFPNDKFVRAKRMGFQPNGEPERVECLIEMPDGSIHVPRGSIGIVKEALAESKMTVNVVEDDRTRGTSIGTLSMIDLRDYQQEGVAALLKKIQGLAILPCGGGKTRLGIGAVAALSITTLVVVPTGDLADQWSKELEKLLGIQAGVLGGGVDEGDRDVVVAIDDSLIMKLEKEPDWAKKFGFLVVDECHHVPSKTLQRILSRVPARYRCGLTATPFRADSAAPLIEWSFGPILVERTTKELIAAGILMPAQIEFVETEWTFRYAIPEPTKRAYESTFDWKKRFGRWQRERLVEMERTLVEDLSRNALIADRAADDAKKGETVLVLTGRREHTKELAEMISARGAVAVALTSGSGKKKRKAAIQDLKDGKLPVMIATSLADEGLDVTRLSRVILAFPQRAKAATLQRLGRLLRDFPDKNPRLIDLIDGNIPTLKKRAEARKKTYQETGLYIDE